ncbi:MAG: hypothetical protein ABH807_01420 [Candidatus Shapirobacteria bacterium]
MKKIILILIVLAALGGAGILGLWGRGKKASLTTGATPSPKKETKTMELTLKERPFVSLTPLNGAKELELSIARIRGIDKIEYELTYLSNDLSRGVIGTINLEGKSEVMRQLTLGSCSRNICKYDENVTEGNLSLRLIAPDGATRLTSDFHLQKGASELTSLDDNFRLSGKFDKNTYYLTMGTLGLPGEFTGEIEGEPYGVFTTASTAIKGAKINLAGIVYGWVGSNWQKIDPNNVSTLTTYIVGK